MQTLYIIRGLPGAGKSTFANVLAGATKAYNFEADRYLINDAGEYDWNPDRVRQAHIQCQRGVLHIMRYYNNDIVLSNTSTTEKEMKPYLDMAAEHGYQVVILIVENRHGGNSVHDVPEETIQRMQNRFSVKLR